MYFLYLMLIGTS